MIKGENIDIKALINNKEHPENTVHYGKRKRFEMAEEQLKKQTVCIKCIIDWTNEFICEYGLKPYDGDNLVCTKGLDLKTFNKNMKKNYMGLTSEKDIIWMKITNDNRLGVVACSNDINFDIPPQREVYDESYITKNGNIKGWKYTTSGILVHYVGLEWNEEVILIFPLIGLKEGKEGTKQRHELETGIGNYLITKDVPIIDYYSHRI